MYSIALWLRHCGCGPTAHKGLKSPKRFTNLPEITTDIGLNCESQGEKGRTFILFLWDGTHSANFDEKVHKPQSKSYSITGANMQLIFTYILWIWILLSMHHNFLGSEGPQGTHIDALNPFSSLTLKGGLWTFLENSLFSPMCHARDDKPAY